MSRLPIAAAMLATMVLFVGCAGQSAPVPGASASGSSTPPRVVTSVAASEPQAPNPNAPEVNAAGDIPDSQVFIPYTAPGGLFTVSVPQGWAQSGAGTATVFTDKFNSVRIEVRPQSAAPDVASVRGRDVPALQASTAGFAVADVQMVTRSAGRAVLLTYSAASAPDAVTAKSVTESVERYAFWRAGQEVVLTLSGARGSDNVDPWRKITDSFRWLR